MTDMSLFVGGSLNTISETVNSKTGTKIKKMVFTPSRHPKVKGVRTSIEYGFGSPLRNMGVDSVSITKIPKQGALVRFFQEIGGTHQGISFMQGAPEMKTFIAMLKDCANKGFKADFKTAKTLLKLL